MQQKWQHDLLKVANRISILYYSNCENIDIDCDPEKLNILSNDFGLDRKASKLPFQMRL